MRCPFCGNEDTQVKDSRPTDDNSAIRRRRQCTNCGARFTTFERVQLRELVVIKRNGRRAPFDRDKLIRSLSIALRKRPVEPERGFVLHRSEQPFEATLRVGQEIKLTSSPDILAALGRGAGPDPVLVALGYAGWGRGQIEAELSSNTWLTVPADPSILFDTPFEQRWTGALGLPGVDIQRITEYAGHA